MTTVPFRRSAVYFNGLVKIANMRAHLNIRVREEKYKETFETVRKQDLDTVFKYIEGSATQGAVRVHNWEWSTPAPIRKLLFEDKEIQKYMVANGFIYLDHPQSIEWWHAEESKAMMKWEEKARQLK